MRFYYRHQLFLSHARMALEYQRILRKLGDEVESPSDADVAVLHYEPAYYGELLQRSPSLRKVYRVGYCVWEADRLPQAWAQHVRLMDELWVPSAYCDDVFSRVHPRVRWLPHVAICPRRDTPQEVESMRQLLGLAKDAFVFFNIAHAGIHRKNLDGLLRAFEQVALDVPHARLVVKLTPQNDAPVCVEQRGRATLLHGVLNPAPLHALFTLCHVYVSPHHAEGWGLAMSDAMLFGKPVVATGYSGNMDYMTAHNSYLIAAYEAPIESSEAYYEFAAPMRWGAVRIDDIVQQMRTAYDDCVSGAASKRVEAAKDDIALYDTVHVRARLETIVDEMTARLRGH